MLIGSEQRRKSFYSTGFILDKDAPVYIIPLRLEGRSFCRVH